MTNFFSGFLQFIFRMGYFGPLVMGILDSSFLVLPFGNDLVVVGMVAHNPHGAPWYILSAACGSAIGVLLLSLVARKLGEEGIKKVAGEKRFQNLRKRIGKRAGLAVAAAGLAPPPFPFTVVIAMVAAVDYPIWRIMLFDFFSRAVRFAALAVLAVEFGDAVTSITKSSAFQWAMIVFIAGCVAASAFSIWSWWRKTRGLKKQEDSARSAA